MKRDWWLIIVILVLALALIATKVRQDRAGSKKLTFVRPLMLPHSGRTSAPLWPANAADHADLQIVEGHVIRPAVGIEFGLVVAAIVAAKDQDMAATEAPHRP